MTGTDSLTERLQPSNDWAAFALALLAVGLIATDQIKIVQASTVVFSLPLLPVLVLMCISLVKWLRADFGAGKDPYHERVSR